MLMFIIGVMLLFPCFGGKAAAAEAAAEVVVAPMIMLERYDVTDEQIVPGEEFTLTLTFKNYSPDADAKGVLIDITNPTGIMPVYGTVSQVYIEEIPAGETREVSINYVADTILEGTSVDFYMTIIISGAAQNYVSIRVPVGTDIPFYILSDKFPTSVAVGENATSSLTFEVIGEADVRSVAHVVSVNGVAIGSNTIGSVTSGTTRSQNTTVAFMEPGEYTVDIEIQYIDKADQQQSFLVDSKTITVYEKEESGIIFPQEIEDTADDDANKSLILGLGGIVLLAVLLLVVIINKKK
uniref:hypothetical protein n=1 Tax=Acetatifactor sp. TaxID=1872090 RepID=UPI0040566B7D